MKVRLRSVKKHDYDGIERGVDSTYDADEEYVSTLVAGGVAVRDGVIHTRDMAAGQPDEYKTREVLHAPRKRRGA